MSAFIKEFFSGTNLNHLVVMAGVDWITLTGETYASKMRVSAMATALLEDGLLMGQKLQRTSRNGYQLSSVDGLQWGTGNRGWMVCLSGQMARKHWLIFYAYSKNCTRLDLQATIAYRDYGPGIIEGLHKRAQELVGEPYAKHATIIQSGPRGDTLYYGSRTSSQFGRVYDKSKQSKLSEQFDNCIRFEVEYKKPLSGQIATWLCDKAPDEKGMTDKVLSWFFERGIEGPAIYSYSDNEPQMWRKESSLERKLSWLRTTVRPTYRQLKLAGFQVEADEALGATDDIQSIDNSDNKGKV